MDFKHVLVRAALLSVPVILFISRTSTASSGLQGETRVPIEVAERAAAYYGQQRWSGCRLLSTTPYFALDGSVNAYAVQFARDNSVWTSEDQLFSAMLTAEQEERLLREYLAIEKRDAKELPHNPVQPSRLDDRAPVVDIQEALDKATASARVTLPPRVPHTGPQWPRGDETRTHDLAATREEVQAAANASVLAAQVGTVIIAGRYDLYPLLERFDGVAPHLKHEAAVRATAALADATRRWIRRTYYLGVMEVLHEIQLNGQSGARSGTHVVDPIHRRIVDIKQHLAIAGAGRLPPASPIKCSLPPRAFWDNMSRLDHPPHTEHRGDPGSGANSISGVPYYHQDDYGAACCGPNASAQALAYWDDHGYGNLVDNGSSTTGHENELIYDLMRAEGYEPSVGTYGSQIEPGIEAVCNSMPYGNNLSFDVTPVYSVSWAEIVTEIDAGRPFVYFNWDTNLYPNWAHFTTGTGYNDNGGNHLLYVHYNYPPDSPYELNWDNISPANEALYKIDPGATAEFECVWSEDFEGAFPGPWAVGAYGLSSACWDDCSHRALNITDHPCPPGGNMEWSAYCADNPCTAPGPYENDMNTWMVYGPFSTVGSSSGEFSAYVWQSLPDVPTSGDWAGLFASVNGTDFYGTMWAGDATSWTRRALDLRNVYMLGNILGAPEVWVAIVFWSDETITDEGAYVDSVTIKLDPCMAFAGAFDAGNNIKYLDWLGWFNDQLWPWIFDYRAGDWLWVIDGGCANVWMWSHSGQEWMWTRTDWAPWYYFPQSDRWEYRN